LWALRDMLAVRAEHGDRDGGRLFLCPRVTRGRHAYRTDPVPPHRSTVHVRPEQALEHAGPADLPLHGLRHTAAAAWLGTGRSLEFVRAQLGHSSVKVTSDYGGHLEQQFRAQGVGDTEARIRADRRARVVNVPWETRRNVAALESPGRHAARERSIDDCSSPGSNRSAPSCPPRRSDGLRPSAAARYSHARETCNCAHTSLGLSSSARARSPPLTRDRVGELVARALHGVVDGPHADVQLRGDLAVRVVARRHRQRAALTAAKAIADGRSPPATARAPASPRPGRHRAARRARRAAPQPLLLAWRRTISCRTAFVA
jgi:hypothetical protein